MERYLNDLRIKWRTSLDLLTDEIGAPYGVFVRTLPDAWEIFSANTGMQSPLVGLYCRGRTMDQDFSDLIDASLFCGKVDQRQVGHEVKSLLNQHQITHYCGFTVIFCEQIFGFLVLGGKEPFTWDSKNQIFLQRFKILMEEDLHLVAEKARYCDELTRTRLISGAVSLDKDDSNHKMLDSIMDFSSEGSDEMVIHREMLPVLPFMDDIHRSHESYMPQGVKLVTRIRCPSDYSLYTDGYCLKQILSSLLKQAENHTWKGEIKVDCRLDRGRETFLFSVSDKGRGITWENWSKGLAPCRILTEKLGGRLTVNTCVEKGNFYILSIPINSHIRVLA
jgi:hypothetical protein